MRERTQPCKLAESNGRTSHGHTRTCLPLLQLQARGQKMKGCVSTLMTTTGTKQREKKGPQKNQKFEGKCWVSLAVTLGCGWAS